MKTNFFCAALVVFFLSGCNSQDPAKVSPPYTGPIIDMHIHAYGDENPLYGLTHPPTLRGETFEGVNNGEELKEEVFARFEKYNIVLAVTTSGHLWKEDAPEVIEPAYSGPTVDALRERHEAGELSVIAEMAPFYAGIQADDPSQLPYFELAEERNIPLGFHILPGGPNNGIHYNPQMLGSMRVYNADPLQLEDVIVQYPNLRVYIMHGGWPYTDDVKALMYAHPDVYVDIAVLAWLLPEQELYNYLKSLIDAGFGKRIMYGSDQMVWPGTIDVGIKTLNDAGFLTPEQKEDIFYDNAATFLGLSQEMIDSHKNQ